MALPHTWSVNAISQKLLSRLTRFDHCSGLSDMGIAHRF